MAEHDDRPERKREGQRGERHPGAEGEKERIPAVVPDQDRREAPIGNGGVNEPAAFPPHN